MDYDCILANQKGKDSMKNYRLLTVVEVAELLGLKPSTIRKMILERRIDVVRPTPRAVRIPEGVVERIIAKGYQKAIEFP